MRITSYVDQAGTIALGAGPGFLLLSRVPVCGHVIAWALVLAGAVIRATTLPVLQKTLRKNAS